MLPVNTCCISLNDDGVAVMVGVKEKRRSWRWNQLKRARETNDAEEPDRARAEPSGTGQKRGRQ